MIILITMGGLGIKFKNNNYKRPKSLINIFGKPIIFYILDNLKYNFIDYIYIPYNKEYLDFNFEDIISNHYSHIRFKFLCINYQTKDVIETIDFALKHLDDDKDKPILCLNCNNFYLNNIIDLWNGQNLLFSTINNNGNCHNILNNVYINIHKDKIILEDKEKVSNLISSGAYGFKSFYDLKKYCQIVIQENLIKNEILYIIDVVNRMIKDQYLFKNITINKNHYISLSCPIELKLFYNNYPKISCITNNPLINSKRICFDLDNILVTNPIIKDDYTTVKPIEKNINFLKYLKKFNNTIIIYTSRNIQKSNNHLGKSLTNIGKITFDTLEKFNIPYDEIYFGKPHADFYIDNLSINIFDDIEKEIGFYNSIIEPRDFNQINISNIEIIEKKGKDLSGEIYYYQNIPNEIKDLFPLFIEGGNNFLKIEKINGITLSELYLSELLTETSLINVLNSIYRIQSLNLFDSDDSDNNIYLNYCNKLSKRYESYNYDKFPNSKQVYQQLYNSLENYSNKKLGIKTVIHGDPVFTNIFINQYEKIKFIDMRGKQGENLSIYGDWIYDWSKIYQSLIGYDEILLSKNISSQYKINMINIFKNYFLTKYDSNDFENLKIITKTLLFTLIPLHNNEKCIKYYNLIFDI